MMVCSTFPIPDVVSDCSYLDRVTSIRACVKPQALRKASAAAEHIQRRYSFLYASLLPPSRPLNPLSVVRWNVEQDFIVCFLFSPHASSDAKCSQKSNLHTRSPWQITPSIVEEYAKVREHQDDEEPTTNLDLLLPSPMPKGASPKSEEEPPRPRRPTAQMPTSRKSFGLTASPASDKWSPDSPRPWISSPQIDHDSPRSSLYNVLRGALGRVSPASSKLHLQGAMRRPSDDSARASLSEPNSQKGSTGPGKPGRLRTPNLDTNALNTSGPESEGGEQLATDMRSPQLSEGLSTAKPPDSAIISAGTVTKSDDPTAAVPPLIRHPLARRRISLPLPDYRLEVEVEKRRQLVDDEREQYEYEIRAQYVTHSPPMHCTYSHRH